MKRILVVGQTPPPFGGQAVMIERLLEGSYGEVALHHVRLNFSREMDEIGSFRVRKLVELAATVVRILLARIRHRTQVLYYPPGGSNLMPILRDMVVLGIVRPFFERVVFHFHSAGWSESYDRLPFFLRVFFRHAYFRPDVAIRLSELSPDDGRRIRARREVIAPYGIPDELPRFAGLPKASEAGPPAVLFIGVLRPSKGVTALVEALTALANRNVPFTARLVGRFQSVGYENEMRRLVEERGLSHRISFPGVLTGDAKWRELAMADVFCFPTYFESESLPVALIEALSFGLPIVTTRWRAVPAIVGDGEHGFVVPIRNPPAVAEKLELLLTKPEERRRLGELARQRYVEEFTLDRYRSRMRAILEEVAR